VLPSPKYDIEGEINMMKINIKKFNVFTLASLLLLIAGIGFYIYWGMRYNVWYDIGIYSITSVFVISGIVGILLTLYEKIEEQI
jgi:hypothetical protein